MSIGDRVAWTVEVYVRGYRGERPTTEKQTVVGTIASIDDETACIWPDYVGGVTTASPVWKRIGEFWPI